MPASYTLALSIMSRIKPVVTARTKALRASEDGASVFDEGCGGGSRVTVFLGSSSRSCSRRSRAAAAAYVLERMIDLGHGTPLSVACGKSEDSSELGGRVRFHMKHSQ